MDDDLAFSESEKPRYLLPEGCKDLYDVIRRQEEDAALQKQKAAVSAALEKLAGMMAAGQPEMPKDLSGALKKHFKGTSKELPLSVTLPDTMTVGELAEKLHLKAFKVISVLVKFQVFAHAGSELSFATASQVCEHFGVAVQKDGDF